MASFFLFFWKNSLSHFNFLSSSAKHLPFKALMQEQLGAGWRAPQKCQGFLQSDWFASGWLFESSPALVVHNYCSENKMINRAANLPDSFPCKIKYLCIYLQLENVVPIIFLSKSFICSLYSCRSSHQKVAVPLLHMNNIQTRLLIYQQNLKLTPGFSQYSFTSLNFTNSVHKSLSNKIETHWQGKGSHGGLQNN